MRGWWCISGFFCCGQNTFCNFSHLTTLTTTLASEHLTHKNIEYKTDCEQSSSWQELLKMTIKGNTWTRWTLISVFCPHGLFEFFLSESSACQLKVIGIFGSRFQGAQLLSVPVSVNASDKTEQETESEHREEQISKAIGGEPKIQEDLNLLFQGDLSLSLAQIHLSAEYFKDIYI